MSKDKRFNWSSYRNNLDLDEEDEFFEKQQRNKTESMRRKCNKKLFNFN